MKFVIICRDEERRMYPELFNSELEARSRLTKEAHRIWRRAEENGDETATLKYVSADYSHAFIGDPKEHYDLGIELFVCGVPDTMADINFISEVLFEVRIGEFCD